MIGLLSGLRFPGSAFGGRKPPLGAEGRPRGVPHLCAIISSESAPTPLTFCLLRVCLCPPDVLSVVRFIACPLLWVFSGGHGATGGRRGARALLRRATNHHKSAHPSPPRPLSHTRGLLLSFPASLAAASSLFATMKEQQLLRANARCTLPKRRATHRPTHPPTRPPIYPPTYPQTSPRCCSSEEPAPTAARRSAPEGSGAHTFPHTVPPPQPKPPIRTTHVMQPNDLVSLPV